jgi:site-specific DNA recombinase
MTDTTGKLAGIYVRLSQNRDRDDDGNITPSQQVQRQERLCRQLAKDRGWKVVEIYNDDDRSASARQRPRPAWQRMLKDIETQKVNCVVALHVDRLYRRMPDLIVLMELAEETGLDIATVQSGALDLNTSAGRMQASILGSVAACEVERLAERTRAGKADAAARGAWQGGQRMYGFECTSRAEREQGGPHLRVVPEECDVVREAAARVLAGESLRSIAWELTARGHTTTRGKSWTGSALRKVLVRPSTAGLRAVAGEPAIQGQWPALVAEDVWRGVVAVLSDPARRTNEGRARAYLGSGLYVCGVCGARLGANTTAGGGRRAAYRCREADRGGKMHVVRDVRHLDEYVIEILLERLRRPDVTFAREGDTDLQAGLASQAAAVRARLDDLARGWASGVFNQSQVLTATSDLNHQLDEIQRRQDEVRRSALTNLGIAADLDGVWDQLGLDRRRAVLDALMTVTVLPRARTGRLPGGGYFDPSTVEIGWLQ